MTNAKIFVIQGADTYFLARIPALPGANASGKTRDEAIANARKAFRAYRDLLEARGVSVEHWKDIDPDTIPAEDTPPSGIFPGEDLPLQEHEIRDFLHQFEASRAALISLVKGLSAPQLEKWPDDPFGTLQATHRIAFQRFSVMEPGDFVDHEIMGRRWTTRRVMRRMLEHEFEHYEHIKEIMAALGGDRPPE